MVWYVAIGSALGGVSRFVLGAFLQQRAGTTFPVGTVLINITGAFLLAFLMRYALATTAISPGIRGFLTTGFCGGYTTFSTFTYDALLLAEDGELGRAAAYVLLSVTVALIGAYCGIILAREIIALREGL
jgi:CrcB protein